MKAGEYLSTLPVLLTRYGVPIAKISAVEYEIKDNKPSVNTMSTSGEEPPKNKGPVSVIGTFCDARFCKKLAVARATYENPETFEEESHFYCEEHLKKIKMGVQEVKVVGL